MKEHNNEVMIDIETLGTSPNSVILTIGAVVFDARGTGIHERLSLRPDIAEQVELGRIVDHDTLDWWEKQSEDAIEEASSDRDRVPFLDVMVELHKFCSNRKAIWANGICFDIGILENAFRELNMIPPWDFWTVRDARTVYEVCGVSIKDGHTTSHKAVEDAEHQAIVVQRAYENIYTNKESECNII